ncbi:MAG: N-acetylmuramoyl-L-alanine amidase [Oscillospiraceae bacterium]
MHFEKKKRNTGAILLVVGIVVVLVLALAAGAVLLFGFDPFAPRGEPPAAWQPAGEVRALNVAAPDPYAAEDDLRAYFTEAADFAVENGFNTIIFEAKQGPCVFWRDKIFPTFEGVAMQDTFFHKLDPLGILSGVLEGRQLQLWLAVDPWAGGDVPQGAKGPVAELAHSEGNAAFAPGHAAYEDQLCQSLAALPLKYPVAAVLFSGLEADGAALPEAFGGLLGTLQAKMAAQGTWLSAAAQLSESRLAEGWAATLLAEKQLETLVALPDEENDNISRRLAAYEGLPAAGVVLAQPPADTEGYFLFAARGLPAYGGALLAGWPAAAGQTQQLRHLASVLQPVSDIALPTGFAIPQVLGVNYPAQNAKIGTEGLFIMGTSDPALPLQMNGEEVAGRAAGGAFGVGVQLEPGDNAFTFSQGDKSITLNVTRTVSTGGGSGGGGGATNDETQKAEKGQAVRVTALIASALKDPGDESQMNETFPEGAVALVEDSVQTWRDGKRTWAYLLKSGDYLLARNCEWLPEGEDGTAAFTGITATEAPGGEWLSFEGAGAPAAYVAYSAETATLTLTFYDTTLALPENFTSKYVGAASVQPLENGIALSLKTTGIWGYSLEYEAGQTRLFLKAPSAKSPDAAAPLSGMHILLDPGHGDTDIGAAGLMGEGARPNEKDVNLALATAIAYRLRQLGAQVSMTRTGDSFPTLQDRLAAQTLEKPDFFLSVHHNSMPLTTDLNEVHGVQAYYYHPYTTPASKAFAQNLLDAVGPATGRKGGDAAWSYFYVTRTTVCPSVLFEYGFMVNPAEFESVTSTEGLYAAAFATADAVVATLPQS